MSSTQTATAVAAGGEAPVDDEQAQAVTATAGGETPVDDEQAQAVTTAVDGWPARLGRRLRPPEPWQHRPASLAAMSRYAHKGRWTRQDGPARFCGVWYFRLVALPVAVLTHYLAWLVQRPSRAITAAAIYIVLVHTGPGAWLLPWPTWLP